MGKHPIHGERRELPGGGSKAATAWFDMVRSAPVTPCSGIKHSGVRDPPRSTGCRIAATKEPTGKIQCEAYDEWRLRRAHALAWARALIRERGRIHCGRGSHERCSSRLCAESAPAARAPAFALLRAQICGLPRSSIPGHAPKLEIAPCAARRAARRCAARP